MPSPIETWRALSRRGKAIAVAVPASVAVIVVAAITVVALLPPGAIEPSSSPRPTDPPLPPLPTPASPSPGLSLPPVPSPSVGPPGSDPILGADGRLTILLLGSDYRPAHPGNRTDAIMVVSVDPASGKAAAFSVPRDTVEFPLASGGVYRPKVNGLYQHLLSTSRDGDAAMKGAVEKAFSIEVDSFVFIGFQGVKELVRAIGGVDVTLEQAYYDPYYQVNRRQTGWGLPKGTSHLGPNEALIFARSRKGDNDFGRARRQQMLVAAALAKVRKQGVDRLPRLLAAAARTVRTDLPLDQAARIFDIVSRAEIGESNRVVFGPRTYASGRGGASFALNLTVCRDWIKRNFPPVRELGTWPETPAPSPAPSASPAP